MFKGLACSIRYRLIMARLPCGVQDTGRQTDKLIARSEGIEHSTVIAAGEHVLARGAQGAKMLESCEVSSLLYTVLPPLQ